MLPVPSVHEVRKLAQTRRHMLAPLLIKLSGWSGVLETSESRLDIPAAGAWASILAIH